MLILYLGLRKNILWNHISDDVFKDNLDLKIWKIYAKRGRIVWLWYIFWCTVQNLHCVKSSRIRNFSGPYFPVFGLHTERYRVSLRIQSECGKIRSRNTLNIDTFHAGLNSATDILLAVFIKISGFLMLLRDKKDEPWHEMC